MAKNESKYVCSVCGTNYHKWVGKCEECGQWSTVTECETIGIKSKNSTIELSSLSDFNENESRSYCGIHEFDRVCGGGIVRGSVILIGGEPGIGKSTLLLQVLSHLSVENKCIYLSGEESKEQICLRASRLSVSNSNIKLACENDIDAVLDTIGNNVDFLVVDSVQTLHSSMSESVPGSITQVRTCAAKLINYAKETGTAIFLVGHVTKDGMIAGPKILEHMVDTVLYFEGERGNTYRILRAIKNRYGSCGEVGIFEMRESGLSSVDNPSKMFIGSHENVLPGNVVFAGIEGSRPILVEVQALVTKSYFPAPRRTVVGCDINRLLTIIAVLEARCNVSFADRDIYLNVAGGLKITEPAGDLAIAISLISARFNVSVPNGTCVFGEIGLTGEIRSVSKISERVTEAKKLQFSTIISPICEECGDINSYKSVLQCAKALFKKEE